MRPSSRHGVQFHVQHMDIPLCENLNTALSNRVHMGREHVPKVANRQTGTTNQGSHIRRRYDLGEVYEHESPWRLGHLGQERPREVGFLHGPNEPDQLDGYAGDST